MHGLLSDWMLWPWYNYWQPAVRLLLLLWLCRSVLRLAGTGAKKLAGPALAAAALAAVALTATHLADYRRIDPDWTYMHGKRLAAFARTHPGRYAMGDRAGLTAYFLGQPLVQLEGIVGDRALVERIRRRAPLEEVLAGYHVDYLIASSWYPLPRDGDRLVVTIPDALQAGTRSPSMTGRFDQPVLAFTNDGRCYSYVFAVPTRSWTAARRSSMGAERKMDSGFPDRSVPER